MPKLLLGLAISFGVAAAPPSVRLVTSPPATAGTQWTAQLAVRGTVARTFQVRASNGSVVRSARAARIAPRRYRLRLVFPSVGAWSLTARVGGRTHRLGTVSVRAREYQLASPATLLLAPGGTLLLAEGGRQRVLRIEPSSGRASVVADGFENPYGLAWLPTGHVVVTSRASVYDVDPGTGTKTLLATMPSGVELGPVVVRDGYAYVGSSDSRVRRIVLAGGAVTTVAGNGVAAFSGDGGPALEASLAVPHGLAFDLDGTLLIGDTGNDRIRRLDLAEGVIRTAYVGVEGVGTVVAAPDGSVYAGEMDAARVTRFDRSGSRTVVTSGLRIPCCMQLAGDGGLFVVDAGPGTLHRVAPDGSVTRVRVSAPST